LAVYFLAEFLEISQIVFSASPAFYKVTFIDWIQLPNWPVFNIADSAIVIAAAIAMILTLRNIAPITPIDKS